jgi:hypothetical protein
MYQVWSKSIEGCLFWSVHKDVTEGRNEGRVTISHCNLIGKGITMILQSNLSMWSPKPEKTSDLSQVTSKQTLSHNVVSQECFSCLYQHFVIHVCTKLLRCSLPVLDSYPLVNDFTISVPKVLELNFLNLHKMCVLTFDIDEFLEYKIFSFHHLVFHVMLATSPFWHLLLLSLQKVVVCYLCWESGHSGNKCCNPICYNCNKPGHVASDCTNGDVASITWNTRWWNEKILYSRNLYWPLSGYHGDQVVYLYLHYY